MSETQNDPRLHAPIRPLQRIVLAFLSVVSVPLMILIGVGLWIDRELSRNTVEITVENLSEGPASVHLTDQYDKKLSIEVPGLLPGVKATQSKDMWQILGSARLVVRTGSQTHQANAGTLLDDDGPHRFRVRVREDSIEATLESNQGPHVLPIEPT